MKTIRAMIGIFMCVVLAITCMASHTGEYVYNIGNNEITVVFESGSQWSEDEQRAIAERMVYCSADPEASTYAFCWLTGHNLTTETVTTITHKVYSTSPRCRKQVSAVTTCSKCDYMETEVLSAKDIVCCPVE